MLTPRSVYRRFETDGVPSSGPHDPRKDEIIQLLELIQSTGGQSVVKNTLAQLNATTPPAETYGGIVLSGSGAGYYSRAGATWVFGRSFPDTFAKVLLAGSGAAQTGAVSTGVNPASIEVFFAKVAAANTGPLTLSISGGPPRPVVNLAGNALSAGEWTGMVMFYLNDANQYQLLIDAGAAVSAAASAGAAAVDATAAHEDMLSAALSAAGASLVTGALPRLGRAAIKALDTTQIVVAYLIEEGREGFFKWRAGNYSARIAADIDEACFLQANAVAAASGAWVRTVDQISTPRTAGKATAGVENLSHNAFVGPAGYWDPAGASNTRPSWAVGDSPANNISHYSLKLTGHYINPDVYGSMVYGGLPNYYSAIASGAHLSHVAGKDNWTEQISSFMFTDHSDLLKDVVNRQGGHGAIIGGAYHVGAGDHVAILGGYETQVWGDSAAMVGGFKNLIGDPTRSTAEQSGTAMVGGTRHAVKGQYHGVVGGIDHKITRQTSYSAMVGGWNNSLGDTSTRSAMATVGGKDNTLLASFSAALGGEGNTVETTATAAVVSGRNAVAKTASSAVLASGKFANNGDAQLERMVWYGAGVGTIIPGAGGAGGGTKPLSLGMVTQFVMRVVASRTDVPDQHWSFVVTGTAKNVSGAGAIIEQTLDARHKTDAAFTVAAEVFGPNLGIRCTGAAGKNVRWLVSCEFTTLNIS